MLGRSVTPRAFQRAEHSPAEMRMPLLSSEPPTGPGHLGRNQGPVEGPGSVVFSSPAFKGVLARASQGVWRGRRNSSSVESGPDAVLALAVEEAD